jgi:ATP-dependent Clp protease ATP-binding subunit ClpX
MRIKFERNKKECPYGLKPESIFERWPILRLPLIRHALFLIRLFCWVGLDAFRRMRNREHKIHLYGIWCFVGLPGAGKTMSLVRYLDEQRRLYGEQIKIITNFYYDGEDEHLSSYDLFLKEYDCPVIFAWDELQNEFNSREYRKFPMQLVHELTQNRKGHGKQLVYTTQTFTAVDKNFRTLTQKVVDCRTYFGRLTSCRYFKREFYEAFVASNSIDRKHRIKPLKKVRFLQSDYMRSRYDSYQRLDYLKGLDYYGLQPSEGQEQEV